MGRCYLVHAGTKGMKWGVRRYQNPDGSLTPAGKKRYARDAREREYNNQDESGTYYKTKGKKGGKREDLAADAQRYVREDLERTQRVLNDSSNLAGRVKGAVSHVPDPKRPKMDLSKMSDQEMRNQINRALLERQYNDMFNPQKESRGKEYVMKTLDVAGSVLGVAGGAVALALGIKQLTGK